MKTRLFVIFIISLNIINVYSQTDVSGAYFSNETWTPEGSPYRVVGDVQIPIGYTLTIEAGVVVEYTGEFEILIKGGINANGTENDSIVFLCSSGISDGVTMLRFVDVDFTNSQISYSKFINPEKALNIQGTCSSTLVVNSVFFSSSEIINEGVNVNILLTNIQLDNVQVENKYNSDNSTITIESSIINTCNFDSKIERINNPCMIVQNSQVNNSSFIVGSDYDSEMELNNLKCNNCTFSTNYGKLIINDSKIINSGFNNHNTTQQCQVFFEVNRSFLINTSIESSVTNQYNEWWSTININQCIIKKDTSTIIGYNEGNISNSIIIGTDNNIGIRILRGDFNNVTIVNNDIGIMREDDDYSFSVTTSNIFHNATYNIQNNSAENISGINNFWGETEINEIGELIYDYYDDINLGEVNINNFLNIPNTDCPILPPRNFSATEVSGGYELFWDSNPESDIAGYKLHYGLFDGFTFQYSMDLGSSTTYTIPNSILSDTIAITAYDIEAENSNDIVEGHESWYSIISNLIPANIDNGNNINKLECIIFPNPATHTIKIQQLDFNNKIMQISIIDINGIILYSEKINAGSIKNIDISRYPRGVYFVKTILENSISVQKVIKN